MLRISLREARRLAVQGALLAAPRRTAIVETVEHLFGLQMDPVAATARAEQLVLWSRLGPYDVGELERLRFETRELFEYRAFILPASDYAVHRETMRTFPRGDTTRPRYVRQWLAENEPFRRYILRELRRRGPLRSRELEDRAVVPWRSGGWSDGKGLGRMLDQLSYRGEIAVARREGNERLWDLAERVLPTGAPRLPQAEIARRVVARRLRLQGLARPEDLTRAFDGQVPGGEQAVRDAVRRGLAVPVEVEGVAGERLAHAELLETPFRGRTTLLSPFDRLVTDRERAEELWGFRYRLEMYVPPAKREYGYYVLPLLHGDRLVGRVDPLLDRAQGLLRLNGVWAEPEAPAQAGAALATSLRSLARWLGAQEVAVEGPVPRAWREPLSTL